MHDLLLEHIVVHGHDGQAHQQVAVVHIELQVNLASVRGAGDKVTKANLSGYKDTWGDTFPIDLSNTFRSEVRQKYVASK